MLLVLILHLSDIHFRQGEVDSPMDMDHHLRNVLVRDLRQQCADLEEVPDAILVSGDIAYAGEKSEYNFAQKWLEEICAASGCDTSAVFVIPGNHDVQRGVASKVLIQAIHNDIKATTDLQLLPGKLTHYLTDEDSRERLYESIENFNDFAARYFCDLFPPTRTKVERRFTLNDGSTLCVTGLNSAFVSSHADTEGSLYVDPSYSRITHEDGVTHLVMCHHPYNWLANGRELEDHLNVVSQIQLFGHEHTIRILPGRDWVRIAASSAHPDRLENGWEPGYNLIKLSIETSGDQRMLNIEAHIRVWQQRPGQFTPKMDGRLDHFTQSIKLEPWAAPAPPLFSTGADEEKAPTLASEHAEIKADASMTSLRTLSIRFFKLTFSKKLEIAGSLNLFEEDDTKLPDHERFRRVLLRARERNVLDALEAALDAADSASKPDDTSEG